MYKASQAHTSNVFAQNLEPDIARVPRQHRKSNIAFARDASRVGDEVLLYDWISGQHTPSDPLQSYELEFEVAPQFQNALDMRINLLPHPERRSVIGKPVRLTDSRIGEVSEFQEMFWINPGNVFKTYRRFNQDLQQPLFTLNISLSETRNRRIYELVKGVEAVMNYVPELGRSLSEHFRSSNLIPAQVNTFLNNFVSLLQRYDTYRSGPYLNAYQYILQMDKELVDTLNGEGSASGDSRDYVVLKLKHKMLTTMRDMLETRRYGVDPVEALIVLYFTPSLRSNDALYARYKELILICHHILMHNEYPDQSVLVEINAFSTQQVREYIRDDFMQKRAQLVSEMNQAYDQHDAQVMDHLGDEDIEMKEQIMEQSNARKARYNDLLSKYSMDAYNRRSSRSMGSIQKPPQDAPALTTVLESKVQSGYEYAVKREYAPTRATEFNLTLTPEEVTYLNRDRLHGTMAQEEALSQLNLQGQLSDLTGYHDELLQSVHTDVRNDFVSGVLPYTSLHNSYKAIYPRLHHHVGVDVNTIVDYMDEDSMQEFLQRAWDNPDIDPDSAPKDALLEQYLEENYNVDEDFDPETVSIPHAGRLLAIRLETALTINRRLTSILETRLAHLEAKSVNPTEPLVISMKTMLSKSTTLYEESGLPLSRAYNQINLREYSIAQIDKNARVLKLTQDAELYIASVNELRNGLPSALTADAMSAHEAIAKTGGIFEDGDEVKEAAYDINQPHKETTSFTDIFSYTVPPDGMFVNFGHKTLELQIPEQSINKIKAFVTQDEASIKNIPHALLRNLPSQEPYIIHEGAKGMGASEQTFAPAFEFFLAFAGLLYKTFYDTISDLPDKLSIVIIQGCFVTYEGIVDVMPASAAYGLYLDVFGVANPPDVGDLDSESLAQRFERAIREVKSKGLQGYKPYRLLTSYNNEALHYLAASIASDTLNYDMAKRIVQGMMHILDSDSPDDRQELIDDFADTMLIARLMTLARKPRGDAYIVAASKFACLRLALVLMISMTQGVAMPLVNAELDSRIKQRYEVMQYVSANFLK